MHVFQPFDPGFRDRRPRRVGDAVDMRASPDVLGPGEPLPPIGRHRRAEGGTDRQRSAIAARHAVLADAEHAVMRAHHAFGAAREHAGDFMDQLIGRLVQMF